MIENQNELIKNFPDIKNHKYQTPKWVGWFTLIYLLGSIPAAAILAHLIYSLKVYTPVDWQLFLNDQYGLIVIPLFFPIFALLMVFFNYINSNFLRKELFTGETDFIIAYQDNVNLQTVLRISAQNIPPATQIFIFAYNRQTEAKLTKRYSSVFERGYWKETHAASQEAKAQGVNLDFDQYPMMNIEKSEKHTVGNVNHLETIELPTTTKQVELQSYLPNSLSLKKVPIPLLLPSYDGHLLTEIGIRVTVHNKNEYTASFDVFLNPMETAFAVEI